MNNSTFKYILSFIFFINIFVCKGNPVNRDSLNYGLTFLAHSTNQDQRTSLNLTPDESLSFSNGGFSINFDINLKEETHTYGYVTKIIFDNISCLNIISYVTHSKFNIILNDRQSKEDRNIEIVNQQKFVSEKWLNINLDFTENKILITIDSITTEIEHQLTSFKNVNVHFGSCKHLQFFSTDVPPMTIRDIVIRDHSGDVKHNWNLSRHNNNNSYDNVNHNKALIENGVWEIDKHTMWSKQMELTLNGINPQIAIDKESGQIYVASNSELYSYDIDSGLIDSTSFKGHPYIGASSQMAYDAKRDRLISYNFHAKRISTYDFDAKRWSLTKSTKIGEFQHHSRLISSKYDELIIWGGYGNHRYNAKLNRVSLNQPHMWQSISADSSIAPRYLSAIAQEDDDNILILGGYGSPTGKQEESPQNFYDLYRVNFESNKITKVWDISNGKNHFTFSNSMIIDTLSNSIYALRYSNHKYNTFISLIRLDINTDSPSMQVISDSLEYRFRDIRSYCDLFLHKKTKSLYAVILHENAPGISCIELFKLAFPPISKESIRSENIVKNSNDALILSITLVILFCTAAAYYIYRNKAKNKNREAIQEPDIQYTKEQKVKKYSHISLIGGFQVFDKSGENITGDFTPTLKQLFLFLLLNTIKNEKGTTSQSLDETFWYDMNKSSATNNRSVNIRKLRLILDKIGNVSLTKKSGYWHLGLGDDVICHYNSIMQLLPLPKKQDEALNRSILNQVIDFAAKGSILPNITEEWLDDYKAEYNILISEALIQYAEKLNVKDDHKLLLKISDIILNIDTIDENAISIKCRTLHQIGQKGLSKQIFDKFCDEHINMLGVKPDFTYKDMIDSL